MSSDEYRAVLDAIEAHLAELEAIITAQGERLAALEELLD